MNKQMTPKQAGSVRFLPCAASALCWPNIPLGFAAFPLALLTFHWGRFMTRRQGEVQWAKAALGPEQGRGAKCSALPLLKEMAQGRVHGLPTAEPGLMENCRLQASPPGLPSLQTPGSYYGS